MKNKYININNNNDDKHKPEVVVWNLFLNSLFHCGTLFLLDHSWSDGWRKYTCRKYILRCILDENASGINGAKRLYTPNALCIFNKIYYYLYFHF